MIIASDILGNSLKTFPSPLTGLSRCPKYHPVALFDPINSLGILPMIFLGESKDSTPLIETTLRFSTFESTSI